MLPRTAAIRLFDQRGLIDAVLSWIPIAVALCVLALLVYGAVQQDLRQSANDPQVQMAEDTAASIAGGEDATAAVPPGTVDVAVSLAPFVIVYDDSGDVRAASATLHGQVPFLPGSVLSAVRQQGEDRFTWQPEPHVRLAAVVTRVDRPRPGFVLAGRSLREVEQREDNVLEVVGLGLAAGLLATFAAVMAVAVVAGSRRSPLRDLLPLR